MAPSLSSSIIRDTVLDAALALAADPIPNIRFNVAKCLEVLAGVLGTSAEGQEIIQRKVGPALRKLMEDGDADVRYFATKAGERVLGEEMKGEPMREFVLGWKEGKCGRSGKEGLGSAWC